MQKEFKFLKVARINNQGDVAIVKSLLEGMKIPYYVTNENFSALYGAADGLTCMDIMVREDRLTQAKQILKEFI